MIRNYKYKIKLMIKSKIFNQINYKLSNKNKLSIKKMNLISNNLKKFKNKIQIISFKSLKVIKISIMMKRNSNLNNNYKLNLKLIKINNKIILLIFS